MVFVEKSLDQMISEIGGVTSRQVDNIKTENGYKWIKRFVEDCKYDFDINHLPERVNRPYVKNILFDTESNQNLLTYLIENCFIRAYAEEPDKPIKIDYFFGPKGFIYQVSDKGVGFDSEKLTAIESKKELVKGVHYQNKGRATKYLLNPKFQATIKSRMKHPTGTTVTAMYTYLNHLAFKNISRIQKQP
ncbi:hypothetical protein CL615_00340 [archaeon]|jgi:hypothetical protein|nr:hypothetical protein [archaeon]MDP6547434.1 hypothetical protein [Candidatus Woesearchaeota archaeon]|tara:strand:+ start:28585 stop:29154 length:570 start_codon:yes stop_codon:yes gene_type:complete